MASLSHGSGPDVDRLTTFLMELSWVGPDWPKLSSRERFRAQAEAILAEFGSGGVAPAEQPRPRCACFKPKRNGHDEGCAFFRAAEQPDQRLDALKCLPWEAFLEAADEANLHLPDEFADPICEAIERATVAALAEAREALRAAGQEENTDAR